MIIYANIPLTLEDAEGTVARWLGQHLSLEDLRLFGADPVAIAGNRDNSQGGNSHLISLPRPNYPAPPKLRINTLYWPTGAARFAWFLGLATSAQLDAIRAVTEKDSPNLKAAQLVIGDSEFQGTIPANGYSQDVQFRQALSAKMWMLPPRCLSGRNPATAADPYDRVWLVPFVDERYFLQTKPTPSYLYGNFFVTETTVPDADAIPPTTVREWRIEFVGRYSRVAMPPLAINGGQLAPPTATASIPPTGGTAGNTTTNAVQRIVVDGADCGTFTLSVTIPSSLLLPDMGAITQTTAPLAWDASPEEIESALHDLLLGRVRWESLIENLSTAIGKRITYEVPGDGWGYPDRVELDRRFESIGLVMDAVAHSIGRRFVQDIDGTISLLTAEASNTRFELNTDPTTPGWRQIAGRETLEDGSWSQGQYVPESIDVVFRDLTRSTRSGTWRPDDNSLPTNTWRTDGGRMVVNVPIETADTRQFSDLVTSKGSLNGWAFKIPGWTETIHTPSLSNTGRVAALGDAYSTLAGFIAADWYDWRRRLFDLRYVGVMPWRMTGFDDHVEFSIGERISDPTTDEHDSPDGYGGYIASTRIQSMPMNFGCSDSLNQIGTLCGWNEDMIQGEVREALDPALHPRLSASRVRAWAWLPAMELQGETAGLLSTHKRSVTITLRSVDATADPGTYFQAVKFFCENSVNWLDCSRYCGTADWVWNESPSLPGAWAADSECTAACEAVPPADDGTEDGDTATTNCVDDGSMTLE